MKRSWLFVPADSSRKLAKSLTTHADVLIFDLEDAVAPQEKAAARACLARFLSEQPSAAKQARYIRVNDLSTGLTLDDLAAVAHCNPDGWVLPKSRNADDVNQLAHYLDAIERLCPRGDKAPARIVAIASEHAEGVFGMASGATGYHHASPRLEALMWGAEDLSADLGAAVSRRDGNWTTVFSLARAYCLLAAAKAGLLAIDTVPTELHNTDALTAEATAAKQDGFSAKAAIHPIQVDVINDCFTASETERQWASAVVAAFADGAGVGVLDGRMLDRPHLRLAERILGIDTRSEARAG